MKDVSALEAALDDSEIKRVLRSVRSGLKSQKKIGFNTKTRVWYVQRTSDRKLTDKERRFLELQGLGSGWKPISKKLDAIRWLHKNLTPDQFEKFCIAILTSHCAVPMELSPKRPVSGADDGFDGFGEMSIDGKIEKVILQVKRFKPDTFVHSNACREFLGTMDEQRARHGFFITTGLFADRFKKVVLSAEGVNKWIELIDQERLADIMLVKGNNAHGFGLYKSPDLGLYYMNESILRRAAS